MKNFLILFYLLNIFSAYSQNSRRIYVVDNQNKPISFVNISFSDDDGVISDENGCFILNDTVAGDSLINISHIAFESTQLNTKSIKDTIQLIRKLYKIEEVVIKSPNLSKIISEAFSDVRYMVNKNYKSTRLLAIDDSIVYYNEKWLNLSKIDLENITVKEYSNIYYSVSSKKDYFIKFPLSSTISRNPYWYYNSKEHLTELINNSYIENKYDSFYKINSITDSTSITLYISTENNRLIRFEKTIKPYTQKGIEIGETKYVYDFEIKNNKVVISDFKYNSTICVKGDSSTTCVKVYNSDIITNKLKKKEYKIFKTLDELKEYEREQKLIDVNLNKYFQDNSKKLLSNTDTVFSYNTFLKTYNSNLSIPNFNSNIELNLFKPNFIAIYNEQTLSYNFYPYNKPNNFNLYSPRVANQLISPIKQDSFNPYGVNKPQISIILGLFDYILGNKKY
ncbi:MAG TPA: hypothetical protein P5132_07695 [Bacteroidales bacterium]|nr:hypothetical protein [Bacteroidales bacterium]